MIGKFCIMVEPGGKFTVWQRRAGEWFYVDGYRVEYPNIDEARKAVPNRARLAKVVETYQ